MIGQLYIDGKDAYSLYSVSVLDGGFNELIAYPPLKSVDSNDWAEDDGIEPDLSNPVLDSQELSIRFASTGKDARFGAFINLLSDLAYHNFDFKQIGKIYRLRLESQSALSQVSTAKTFTLKFVNDFPLNGYTYQKPGTNIVSPLGYELDDRSLSDYGITVLGGTEVEILKSPAVKKNLLVNINSRNGAIYDGEYVTFQTKDVNLNLLMRANTIDELWKNYDAFLYDLIRPGERRLYVDPIGYEYPCFYKSCSVTDFSLVGRLWLQFNITLEFTSFRVGEEEYLLVSEDDFLIMTEEDDYAINLSEYAD